MPSDTFRTILVPVDFSEVSAYALRSASMMGARCGTSRIIAMYAGRFEAPPYFTVGRLDELQKEFRESLQFAEASLRKFVNATLESGADKVETRVIEALPADGIWEAATLQKADLIVMGTHGRSGLNRWMLGSVAERVLRESPVPVLTVRSAPREPLRRILCAVHDTDLSRRALGLAAEIAACFEARLTVLHVRESSERKPIANLCGWVPEDVRARCSVNEVLAEGDAAETIVRLAADEPYDLVVLGAPYRQFFEGLVLGTTTVRTVRHAPCPVLTVRARPAAVSSSEE